ncbi:NYN domain-containing protein [Dehalobacter sp. DCM]|uniref:NYN domain-containing protein n=1 Tax=Dehalobacter sp. DCM TaxID=2907827 RepID=UPI003081C2FF|nr:NYN domain-containing protein [Dehalobacter sp. DCM]
MKALGFVDYENIWQGLHENGYRLQPEEFIQLLEDYAARIGVELIAVYLYANFDKEEFWRTQTAFEKNNIFTRHVYGKNNYVNTDIRANAADTELMLEVQEILVTRPEAADIFLLFTSDGDFLPIIRRIRAWGKEVRIIGVKDKINHRLYPYCEGLDVFYTFLNKEYTKYNPGDDFVEGVKIIAQMQMRLPYLASTRARSYLVTKLGRSTSEIKEFIHFLLAQDGLIEKEFQDPHLVIKKTKIYQLNLANPQIAQILDDQTMEQLTLRYARLASEMAE